MILIADDDRVYTQELQAVLIAEGFDTVKAVYTGRQAIELLATEAAPAAVILDMMLPYDEEDYDGATPPSSDGVARGVTLLQEMLRIGYDPAKVIVITALCRDGDLQPIRELGAAGIFTKPISTLQILQQLRRIVFRDNA